MIENHELDRIADVIASLVKKQLMDISSLDPSSVSFADFELEVSKHVNDIGAHLLKESMSLVYGDGYLGSQVETEEDVYSCFERKRERSLLTVFGKIRFGRAIYTGYDSGGTKSFLDEKLGIEHKKISPLVTYWMNLMGTIASFDEASDVLNKLRGIKISKSHMEESTEKTAHKIERKHEEEAKAILLNEKNELIPSTIQHSFNAERLIYVESDGCHINTYDGWKECKTFLFFELEGEKEKQQLKNKYYFSTLRDIYNMKRHFKYHLEKYCGSDPVKIVCIGDGAKWIWKTLREMFPEDQFPERPIEIIDWYHAVEKIEEMAKEIIIDNNQRRIFVDNMRELLSKGDIELIEQDLKILMDKTQDSIKRNLIYGALTYFKNNKERMRYHRYKEEGYCIGSGAIESANKYVVQRRLKLPGMKWDKENANAMAHLRAEYINGNLEQFFRVHTNSLLNSVIV
jgi:hypothetical protein